jgi:hypothetical protein
MIEGLIVGLLFAACSDFLFFFFELRLRWFLWLRCGCKQTLWFLLIEIGARPFLSKKKFPGGASRLRRLVSGSLLCWLFFFFLL